ncbi:MAG: PQQ-dependent sugar dehydrogenase [Bacteroidota bacterium]
MKILLALTAFLITSGMFLLPHINNKIPGHSPRESFEMYCAGCHGFNMERFPGKTYEQNTSPEYLGKMIREGIPELGMPSFRKTFTDEETADLVAYLTGELRQQKPEVSTVHFPAIINSLRQDFRLDTVLTGLDVPWSLLFLPDGDLLVAERSGQIFRFRDGKFAAIIEGLPPVFAKGQGGLFDMILHPDYKNNGWIYLSYAKISPDDPGEGNTAVMRARLKNDRLADQQIIFTATPYSEKTYHFGGRMVFDNTGHLYITIGDRGRQSDAQLLSTFSGKVHRLNDDGSIPADNPFYGQAGAIPSTYTYGHRNPQGLFYNKESGELWANEHGPRGGDELNLIRKGRNYGWPAITYGINYDGTIITADTALPGMEQPVHQWTPSIAPGSLYQIPEGRYTFWKDDFLSGSLSFRYLERTRIKGGKTIETEKLLDGIGRIRYVTVGPDGLIYLTVEKPGAVFRLLPIEQQEY